MALLVRLSPDGKIMTIAVTDRFDFTVFNDLRRAYEGSGRRCCQYIIDLKGISYIDSSALGVLLELREYAGNNKDALRLKNVSPIVQDILRITNLDKLMMID